VGIEELRAAITAAYRSEERLITEGFCKAGDRVLLVMPQDKSAPKGRLIQPQVQTIRELLDRGCIPICCTPERMAEALAALATPPELIITDSQAFEAVYTLKPAASVLTSFSILFARYKGDISLFTEGVKALGRLTPTSRILIAEACTHTPQNEDIGRVKLPRILRKKFGEGLHIDIVGGANYPEDLTPYDLVIHCGACMFNRRHVLTRIERARKQGVAITNYGVILAALSGILDRVKTE
jgi:[FeFe] hydrogenase H-cluster maturation GTPase HydF